MSVPPAPTNLVGVYVVPNNYIDFTWTPPPSGSVLYYSLYFVPSVGIPGSFFIPYGQTSYRVNSLTYGLTYTFYMTATNAMGESLPSASTPSFRIIGKPLPPVAVVASSLPGSTTAKVFWQPPTDLKGSTISSYIIQVYVSNSVVQTIPTNSAATNYSVPNLVFGTTYQFAVAANTTGGTTDYSVLSAPFLLTPSIPTAPTNVIASSNPGEVHAQVSWTASEPLGSPIYTYEVLVLPDNRVVLTNSSAPTATISNLLFNTSYNFVVSAVNGVGQSPASTPSPPFFLTNSGPEPPTGVVATSLPGSSEATVSWTPGRDNGSPILSYTVLVLPTGGSSYVGGTTAGTSLSINPLLYNLTYQFEVSATNALGTGAYSLPSASFTLTPSVPDAPTDLAATSNLNETTAHLTWTAPADDHGSTITGYRVFLRPSVGIPYTVLLPGAGTSGDIPGLFFEITYELSIQAVSNEGNSQFSSPVVVFSLYGVPDAPYGVVSFLPSYLTPSPTLQIFWNAPLSNNGGILLGYQVKVWINGQAQTPIYETGLTTTGVIIAYLQFGVAYQFSVAAVSNYGVGPFSSLSSPTTLEPVAPPYPPTNVQAEVVPGQTSAQVFWNEPAYHGGEPIVSHTLILTNLTTGEITTFGPI